MIKLEQEKPKCYCIGYAEELPIINDGYGRFSVGDATLTFEQVLSLTDLKLYTETLTRTEMEFITNSRISISFDEVEESIGSFDGYELLRVSSSIKETRYVNQLISEHIDRSFSEFLQQLNNYPDSSVIIKYNSLNQSEQQNLREYFSRLAHRRQNEKLEESMPTS
ncbi:MAG: hypothetical protein EOM67_08555 [Spirochaetia bacterium]|nr:hypothetical protein [Spirochaetia bacterium]